MHAVERLEEGYWGRHVPVKGSLHPEPGEHRSGPAQPQEAGARQETQIFPPAGGQLCPVHAAAALAPPPSPNLLSGRTNTWPCVSLAMALVYTNTCVLCRVRLMVCLGPGATSCGLSPQREPAPPGTPAAMSRQVATPPVPTSPRSARSGPTSPRPLHRCSTGLQPNSPDRLSPHPLGPGAPSCPPQGWHQESQLLCPVYPRFPFLRPRQFPPLCSLYFSPRLLAPRTSPASSSTSRPRPWPPAPLFLTTHPPHRSLDPHPVSTRPQLAASCGPALEEARALSYALTGVMAHLRLFSEATRCLTLCVHRLC